ncbi:MAG: hypothetical protein AAGK98_12200 [Pseudomonadota bacterium]
MSNLAGKAYAMNVVTPSKRWRTWMNRFLFMVGRGRPGTLAGLMGLKFIHFARWVIISPDQWPRSSKGRQKLNNDYMLFCSNFNGTWDQYIDAFSDGIPSGLDLFWYSATKYPGSIPISSFKRYITFNQVYTDYYYNATPGSAQRDIKAAMLVNDTLRDLAKKHANQSPAEFARSYNAAMLRMQGAFGEPGYGPVASLDTEEADVNREPFVKRETQRRSRARSARMA